MSKRISWLFLFLISVPSLTQYNLPKLNPSNTIIVWDFNDVLVKKDWPAMSNKIISIAKKNWTFIGFLFWPPFLKELYDASYSCGAAEQLLEQITAAYPSLKPYWNDLLELVNLHRPIPESVQILTYLKEIGFKNYLASNMGQESFEIALKNFTKIFDNIDGSFFPKKNKTGYSPAKPCLEYFIDLRDFLSHQGINKDMTIIFIDDRQNNIQSAINSNHKQLSQIYGIHFQSPEQLNTTLAKLLESYSLKPSNA